MSKKGTGHHKLHGLTGIAMALSLPFALGGMLLAVSGRMDGLTGWIGSPFGAISSLVFLSAAIWYCKLEFEDVVLDYFSGGLRSFGLLANKLVALVIWAVSVYAILKIWLGL